MSELMLCGAGIASMPYYIENAALNIYSIEELSYYMLDNLYVINKDFFGEELITWMEHEFNEKKLAEKLRSIKGGNNATYQLVMTVLIASGYCSKAKLLEADEILKELQNKSEVWCRKLCADRYQEAGQYAKSIVEYQNILKATSLEKEEASFVGDIWHNLGCAYAKLFLYEEAMDCFSKAYEKNKREDSKEKMALVYRMMNAEEPMNGYEGAQFKRIFSQAREAHAARDNEKYKNLLIKMTDDWKKEYRFASRV